MIVHDMRHYPLLQAWLSADRVGARFAGVVHGSVERHELPHLGAFNFAMRQALGGGVIRSLTLDAHGKCRSGAMLSLALPEMP